MEGKKKIVIVRLSALGDVTLLTAVVRTLRKAIPDAEITWIIGRNAYQLLEGIRDVEFFVIDKPSNFSDFMAFSRQFRNRHFDVLLAAQASLRANLLYPLIRAHTKIGFDRKRARDGQWLFTNQRIAMQARQHLLDSFFSFLEPLGIKEKEIAWNLPLSTADREWVSQRLATGDAPIIAVNPAASKPGRNWLPERYVSVIREAQRRWGAHIVLTGGSSLTERELGQYITEHCRPGVSNLIGGTTPKQLAAVLEKAVCLIAPDTGPVHIAVAVGTPVIGLYAVAPAWLSGPYLYPHLVVDCYAEAVERFLNLNPQHVAWGVRVHKGEPMALITVDKVVDKLTHVMTAYA